MFHFISSLADIFSDCPQIQKRGKTEQENWSAVFQQDVLCVSPLFLLVFVFSPERRFNQWSESAHQQKILASKSFAKTKEGISDFHMPPFQRRICLVIRGASVAAADAFWTACRVRHWLCEHTKWRLFFCSVCFSAPPASGSKGWPWLSVLTGLCWD